MREQIRTKDDVRNRKAEKKANSKKGQKRKRTENLNSKTPSFPVLRSCSASSVDVAM
jgi:hypothetical protein